MLKHNNSLDLATPIYRAIIVLYNIGNREDKIDKQSTLDIHFEV